MTKETDFSALLQDIMERGEFTTQIAAAEHVGISAPMFSQILHRQRTNLSYMIADRIRSAHAALPPAGANR